MNSGGRLAAAGDLPVDYGNDLPVVGGLVIATICLVGVATALGDRHPVAGGALMATALVAVLAAHVVRAMRTQLR